MDDEKEEEIQLLPGLAQPNLRAGIPAPFCLNLNTTIVSGEKNQNGFIEFWAENDDKIYACFTDEEEEGEDAEVGGDIIE